MSCWLLDDAPDIRSHLTIHLQVEDRPQKRKHSLGAKHSIFTEPLRHIVLRLSRVNVTPTMRVAVFAFFTFNLAATALALASPAVDFEKRSQGELFFSGSAILPRQAVGRLNLQAFTGALGGVSAPAITNSGDPERPFEVDGDTFVCRHRHYRGLPRRIREKDRREGLTCCCSTA